MSSKFLDGIKVLNQNKLTITTYIYIYILLGYLGALTPKLRKNGPPPAHWQVFTISTSHPPSWYY